MAENNEFDVGRELGKLNALVEKLSQDLKDHMDKEDAEREAIHARLKPIEEGIIVRRGIFNFLRLVIASIGFLLALKFDAFKHSYQLLIDFLHPQQ